MVQLTPPERPGLRGEIGPFIPEGIHVFFAPTATFALRKAVWAGNYTCERRCTIECNISALANI